MHCVSIVKADFKRLFHTENIRLKYTIRASLKTENSKL